jgi:hypothetical protein
MNAKQQLHDRINRIINTPCFETTLEREGVCLFDFQSEWVNYASFDELPEAFRKAILSGEEELAKNTAVLV